MRTYLMRIQISKVHALLFSTRSLISFWISISELELKIDSYEIRKMTHNIDYLVIV